MSKKPKKTSATVVLAVVLLFSGIAVIAASFGMQEWQIRQDADEYEALMQSVKAPPQSPMEESSKHLPDENAADAASTDIPMQSEESPAGIPVSTDVPMATASPPPEQSAAPVSDAASRTAASGASGIDLAACKAQNSDFIAWLQIPGTTDIPDAFPVEEPPVLEKLSAENADAAETDDVLDEPPAVEDDLQEPAANEPQEEPIPYPIRHEIAAHAYAYLLLDEALQLYGSPELTEPIFTAASGSVMLATAFFEQADDAILTVHFLADSGEVVTAYAAESSVSAAIVTDSELFALTDGLDYMPILVNDT